MVDLNIFKGITTESTLSDIEAESESWVGLYVDMSDKEQRKFVKDKASEITSIIKTLERSRVDKVKLASKEINDEAKSIVDRLKNANKPFTLLIDEHKKERALILSKEKEVKLRKDSIDEFNKDHELAIAIDLGLVEAKRVVNNQIVNDLVSKGVNKDCAILVTKVIAKGFVRNLNIKY